MTFTPEQIAKRLGKDHLPNEQQCEIITYPLDSLLVVAGAGSGKTETMASRVVYLVANGLVKAHEVLGLTFTRKAAGELSERISNQLLALQEGPITDPLSVQAEVSTYNSFAANLVSEYGLLVGVDPDSTLLTQVDALQVMTDLVESSTGKWQYLGSLSATVEDALSLAQSLSDNLVSDKDWEEEISATIALLSEVGTGKPAGRMKKLLEVMYRRQELFEFVKQYRAYKQKNSLLDFSDQVRIAAEIAEKYPQVGKQLRQRYRVVLLDEFQDTSVSQLRFLSALFKNHPVTAVGDPNQAIYSWRGASYATLELFESYFSDEPVDVLDLTTAWRNGSKILEFANAASEPLRDKDAKLQIKELEADTSTGSGQVVCFRSATLAEEAGQLASYLAQNWNREGTCAVLCRKRVSFLPIATALRQAGLQVQVLGSGGLLEDTAVALLRAALAVVADPGAGDFAMELLLSLNLGPADLKALHQWAKELASEGVAEEERQSATVLLTQAIDTPPEIGYVSAGKKLDLQRGFSAVASQRLKWLGQALRNIRQHQFLPIPELVNLAMKYLDLDILAVANPSPNVSSQALEQFAFEAGEFYRSAARPTLRGFLAWVDLAEDSSEDMKLPEIETLPGAVQLLTVHAAKGLEWDWVAVPTMCEWVKGKTEFWTGKAGMLPFGLRGDSDYLPEIELAGCTTNKALEKAESEAKEEFGLLQEQESRRLFYVAVTRAKKAVILSSNLEGFKRGKDSDFFEEALKHPVVQKLGVAMLNDAEIEQATSLPDAAWPAPDGDLINLAKERAAGVEAAIRARDLSEIEITDPALKSLFEEGVVLANWKEQVTSPKAHLPATLATTKLAALEQNPEEFQLQLLRPIPAEPSAQARLGTVFHAWVELQMRCAARGQDEVEWQAPASLTDSEMARIRHWQKNFRNLQLWNTYEPIAAEVAVAAVFQGIRIPARVDAVLKDKGSGQFVIIDWKTGAIPQTEEDRLKVARQLQVYRLIWSKAQGLDPKDVQAKVCYVGHSQIFDVRELSSAELDATQIGEILRQV